MGIPFNDALVNPYQGDRMTDGLHPESLPIADPDFHTHTGIDPKLADMWKEIQLPGGLSDFARRVAAEYGYELPGADSVQSSLWVNEDSAFTIQRGTAEQALFCVPVAGGIVFPYYALAYHMGPDQPVYGLQDPATDGERRPYASIEEMATFYIEAMRRLQPEGPYNLCGWSFGGIVAYEIARQLKEQGEPVGLVGIIDTAVRDERDWLGGANLKADIKFFASAWISALSVVCQGLYDFAIRPFGKARREPKKRASLRSRLRLLWLDKLHQFYLKRASKADVVDYNDGLLAVEQPSLARFVGIFRANTRACKRYVRKPYSGRVTLIKATHRPRTGPFTKAAYGWDELVPEGRLDVHTVSGDHFTIMRNPKVKQVSKILREAIENACYPKQ